ncbi:MAG TPA: hypothetical protein VGK67_39265 [Myxococcales bacterium]|jgi:hypothetical protein
MPRLLVLACLALLVAPSCFAPTWEARLAVDGGAGRKPDAGAGQCDPPCPTGLTCDNGICLPCQRDCAGRACGDDGCGGTCGSCDDGMFCSPAGQCGGCPASLRCGGSCCGMDQSCIDGACETCGCGQRECGTDACGLWCGNCATPKVCSTEGRCVGVTCSCDGKECGDDGCGKSCGECLGNSSCQGGQCVCQRFCDWVQCGDDGCGGSCGECGPGSVCQWGTCVSQTCEPPCSEFQWCDTSAGFPYCVEICNPPMGCQPGEICDVMSGKCQPATCNGTYCAAGQGCYDPWTLGPGNVCTCLPGHYDDAGNWIEDTCAVYGQACQWDWSSPAASVCGAPREFETCQVALGCQPGLDCVDFGGGSAMFLQPCTKTAECSNPMTNCLPAAQRHCWYAICAEPEKRPGDRLNYFKACPSASVSDGICLPYASQDSYGNPLDLGVCVQTGSAPLLGKCSVNADRTRMGELCPQGQWCEPAAPDPSRPGEMLGVCRAACNSAPSPVPVAGCSSPTEICADMSSAGQGTMNEARLGACHASCDLLGTGACPSDALGNPEGCMPNFNLDGTAFCYAQVPGAAGKGQLCVWDTAADPRNPCADRLYCNDQGGGGSCSGFCDTAVCADPYRACPACAPFSMCYPLGGNLGVCL